MAREMFLFQSAWWNIPSWLDSLKRLCSALSTLSIPQLVFNIPLWKAPWTTWRLQDPTFRKSWYWSCELQSCWSISKSFQLIWGPSIETWASFFTFKSLTASSNFAFKSSALVCPRKAEVRYLASPYLVQSTSQQSPFALATALDWRTHQMTEQSKVLLSTQQAVVPWSRVQFQMQWGMKAWVHHKTTAGQFCCLETWLWTHLQYPGLSYRRNGTSQTSMPKEFLPCVVPGSKWTLKLILSQTDAFLLLVYLAVILMLRLLFLLASSNSPWG